MVQKFNHINTKNGNNIAPKPGSLTKVISSIRDATSAVLNKSPFLEFIFHPSYFLGLLSELYQEYPELRQSPKIRKYKKIL